jgi:hypothetical protein
MATPSHTLWKAIFSLAEEILNSPGFVAAIIVDFDYDGISICWRRVESDLLC